MLAFEPRTSAGSFPGATSPAVPAAALAGTGPAAFVVDRGLKVLVANQTAFALAAAAKDLSITFGRLRIRDAVLNARLERSAREPGVTGDDARLTVVVNGRRCTVEVMPLGAPDSAEPEAGAPHALILVREPKADVQINVERVGHAFGLTAAETRMLKLVCEGHSTVSAAKRLNIATTTARTHLARIFSKTETRRQSELVQFVTTFVPSAH